MSAIYSGVTYGGVSLNLSRITPVKEQKTRKQVVGKTLIETQIIGLSAQQWRITVRGTIKGIISTGRAALEALDDVSSHAYVDGIHDGNYYLVPGSLEFQDEGDRGNSTYVYSFELIEV